MTGHVQNGSGAAQMSTTAHEGTDGPHTVATCHRQLPRDLSMQCKDLHGTYTTACSVPKTHIWRPSCWSLRTPGLELWSYHLRHHCSQSQGGSAGATLSKAITPPTQANAEGKRPSCLEGGMQTGQQRSQGKGAGWGQPRAATPRTQTRVCAEGSHGGSQQGNNLLQGLL